ncbi:hypothetical protein DFO56_10690 [Kosakonia sp. AG348]|nr:hypothetical protein DFO56_10690 [Kosakonia sp. AG348]
MKMSQVNNESVKILSTLPVTTSVCLLQTERLVLSQGEESTVHSSPTYHHLSQ